jgi:F420-dependent oxidoreductase-like protein
VKLGLAIGYSGAHLDVPVALVQRAEELGYDSVWSAEAYGSDAITPLAFLAAKTNRIRLGTGIMQLAARTPANAAMSAASIDAMAGGGRFIAGLGVSGPQIVEGWYGQPWGKPYYRVKDYVAIMRKIFKREGPVTHEGREISLPYKGEGSAGLAKPLKSILHMNPDIPIYLATGGEAMVKLTAEIADGWLPMGFVPGAMEEYGPWLEEGFRRAGNGKSLKDFTIQASVHVEVDNDVKGGADAPQAGGGALCGRHGSPDQEFSQRHHGPARLRRRRRAHPGTIPRGPQGRSHRHRARRVGRSEIAGRPTGAHPRTLPRLGEQRRGFAQRAIAPAGSHRGDGQGRAAELRS